MDERFQALLLAVLVIIFWAVLFPVINDATGTAATRHFNATGLNEAAGALENVSASAKAIVNLVPLVYAFAGPGVAIAIVYLGFKS